MDEMDLTPYEDDDDATLHRKFCAAKVARKRAEEDLKLLCNRIGLLKMEEGKVSIKTHSHFVVMHNEQLFNFHINNFASSTPTGCQKDRRDAQKSQLDCIAEA